MAEPGAGWFAKLLNSRGFRQLGCRTLILFIVAFVSACSPSEERKLRVEANVWPGYAAGFVAEALDLWETDRIQMVRQSSASEVARAFQNGIVEVAALTLDEALRLADQGEDIRIFFVADESAGADVILGKPPLSRMRELKGKRVAVEMSALGAFFLTRALEVNNMPPDAIEIVPITVDQSVSAYHRSDVDAVVTFEPFRTEILAEGAVSLFDSSEIRGEILDVLVVREKTIKSFAKGLKRLVKAWLEANRMIQQKNPEALKIAANHLELRVDEVPSAFDEIVLPDAALNEKMLTGTGPETVGHAVQVLVPVMRANGLLRSNRDFSGLTSRIAFSE